MCILGHAFNAERQTVHNYFSFIMVRQKWELRVFSSLLWAYAQPRSYTAVRMWADFQIPKNTSKFFKALYDWLILLAFFLSVFIILLFATTHISASWSSNTKLLLLTTALGKKLFALGNLWVRSNKDKPYKWDF